MPLLAGAVVGVLDATTRGKAAAPTDREADPAAAAASSTNTLATHAMPLRGAEAAVEVAVEAAEVARETAKAVLVTASIETLTVAELRSTAAAQPDFKEASSTAEITATKGTTETVADATNAIQATQISASAEEEGKEDGHGDSQRHGSVPPSPEVRPATVDPHLHLMFHSTPTRLKFAWDRTRSASRPCIKRLSLSTTVAVPPAALLDESEHEVPFAPALLRFCSLQELVPASVSNSSVPSPVPADAHSESQQAEQCFLVAASATNEQSESPDEPVADRPMSAPRTPEEKRARSAGLARHNDYWSCSSNIPPLSPEEREELLPPPRAIVVTSDEDKRDNKLLRKQERERRLQEQAEAEAEAIAATTYM